MYSKIYLVKSIVSSFFVEYIYYKILSSYIYIHAEALSNGLRHLQQFPSPAQSEVLGGVTRCRASMQCEYLGLCRDLLRVYLYIYILTFHDIK